MDLMIDWMAVFIIIALGVMIKYLKMHWLIAGYNTSNAEDRKVMSEKGIGEFMGNGLFVLAAVLALGNLGKYLGYPVAQTVSWILFIVVIGFIVIKAQRFAPARKDGKSGTNKTTIALVIGINVLVFGLVAALIIGGNRESAVTIEGHQVKIGGIYSTRIDLREVTDIRMEESIPDIKSRTNGYAFGNTLKGHFLLQDLGKGRLYLHSRRGPFIYIMRDRDYIIVNFDNPDKTRKLYDELLGRWDKS